MKGQAWKWRRKITLAKIEQHEPVSDHELAEIGMTRPSGAGWWRDPLDFTWRWMSPAFLRAFSGDSL